MKEEIWLISSKAIEELVNKDSSPRLINKDNSVMYDVFEEKINELNHKVSSGTFYYDLFAKNNAQFKSFIENYDLFGEEEDLQFNTDYFHHDVILNGLKSMFPELEEESSLMSFNIWRLKCNGIEQHIFYTRSFPNKEKFILPFMGELHKLRTYWLAAYLESVCMILGLKSNDISNYRFKFLLHDSDINQIRSVGKIQFSEIFSKIKKFQEIAPCFFNVANRKEVEDEIYYYQHTQSSYFYSKVITNGNFFNDCTHPEQELNKFLDPSKINEKFMSILRQEGSAMKSINTFIIDKEFKIDEKVEPFYLDINNEVFDHIMILPVILSQPELFRELCKKILKIKFPKPDEISQADQLNRIKPIIFISSISWLDSFFKIKSVEKWDDRLMRFLKTYSYSSFLFNSSAWIQFVELEYLDGKINWALTKENYEKAKNHHERIGSLKIFENANAKEYLEYNFRLQEVNYLQEKSLSSDTSGHGRHISPNIYSNEQKLREEIVISKDLVDLFTDDINNKTSDFEVKGVTLRILLVDDKFGSQSECKAKLIKDLLELKFEPRIKKEEKESIRSRVCWRTPLNDEDTVKIFQLQSKCETCTIIKNCGIKTYNEKISLIEALNDDTNKGSIQIIPVKSLELARQLLKDNNFSFDLIMMDYLLDKKKDKDGKETDDREYATDFWGDGNEKYFELPSKEKIIEKYKGEKNDEKRKRYLDFKESYGSIKQNRGPMQRLWIFPITAFNQTFIDDLRNKGVRLIDYYWYLSRGADPINTPYLFISTLNQFLQLQLENAFFSIDEIMVFLKKTLEKLYEIKDLDDFCAFMGAEYTIFVERYMTRAVAYRDRKAGSLFANYVWNNFYNNKNNKSLFILVQKIEKFYHCCSFGTEADMDKMIILHRELKTYLMENFPKLFEISEIDKFYRKIVKIKSKL